MKPWRFPPVLIAVLLLVLVTHRGVAAPRLQGTWRLDTGKSRLTGGLLQYRATLEQVLTIDVVDDQVTVVTSTSGIASANLGRPTVGTEVYDVDGQARSFPYGDTIPRETMTRSATWLPDMNGFDLTEVYSAAPIIKQRWTLADNG